MDRGAWRATVHTVAKSWTQLSDSVLARTATVLDSTHLENDIASYSRSRFSTFFPCQKNTYFLRYRYISIGSYGSDS